MTGIYAGIKNPLVARLAIIAARTLVGTTRPLARVFGQKRVMDSVGRLPLVRQDASRGAIMDPLMASMAVFVMCGNLRQLSTDFVTPEFSYVFRRCLDIGSKINAQLPPEKQILLPNSFSLSGVDIPILHNVPIERVLDTVASEEPAFETFKASLNERLLSIAAPVGSIERDKEIQAIKESVLRDTSKLNVAYRQIKKKFSKRLAFHIALGASSIVVAGFSTIGKNMDVLSVAGSVFAGTTLGVSIKDLVKDWLGYQKEVLKLQENENYFVWKIGSMLNH